MATEGITLAAGSASAAYLHGIRNAKVSLSGTTLSLDAMSGAIGANPIRVAMALANGTLQWLDISAALSIVFPSSTYSRSKAMMGFSNTDGESTLTLSGNAVDVLQFVYVINDSGTPLLGVSRSPFHAKMPTNYWHSPSATSITPVGTDRNYQGTSTTSLAIGTGSKAFTTQAGLAKFLFVSPTRRVRAYSAATPTDYMEGTVTAYDNSTGALTINMDATGGSGTKTDWRIGGSLAWTWDDMIISKSGALTDADAPCVCIGPLCYGTISGSTGRFSAMSLVTGEFPKWNNRDNPSTLDGSRPFAHVQWLDTPNGFGSTDIYIRKYSNNSRNYYYAIQTLLSGGSRVSGSVGGLELVITEPGRYAIIPTEGNTGGITMFALSVNDMQRTISADTGTLRVDSLLSGPVSSGSNGGYPGISPYVGMLDAGDVVAVHGSGHTGVSYTGLRAVKLGWK